MSPAPTVRIIPESFPGADLTFKLGAEIPAPVPGSGIAKYSAVTRPRRRDANEFISESPLQVTFSIIKDEWANDGNLGDIYYRIFGWAAKSGLTVMPTVLRTEGPIPFSYLRWILTNIEQVEVRQRQSDWALSYFELKLELTEWLDIDLIHQGPPTPTKSPAQEAAERAQQEAQRRASVNAKVLAAKGIVVGVQAAAKQRTYQVRQGDTLSAIAARELGKSSRWPEIASLNAIRDPNRISPGQVLKMPG